ncbi:MobQ family relaxase [Paenibacillus sp. 453mf]|uniref:MobQ family relaxase n=1 Tax=Paenibacillus sp. 453mf TaxID=1761874 RepID=UPI0008EA15F5|nr:MobQ family relaxase [Paenibacillus sp. 453mf]SFS99679.1 MobA/MobL family protein [Paenibacillus sp. 453mf]
MGYFYFSSQILNRMNHSAVAAAAYRSGEPLYSERDGLTKNYGERTVAPDCFILAPKNAPEWVNNRERLWNEVEKIEKQKNAQIAREIRLALPNDLNNDDQKELLLQFCKENFSDEGMVADVAIHRDKENNPHAHVMLTMRPFNEDGSWGNKRQKVDKEVNGVMKKVSVHLTNWNEKETLVQWRKNYADLINEKLKDRGIEDRVSHESYKNQGLDRIPGIRLERTAFQYETRVKEQAIRNNVPYEPVTYYGKINEEIKQINSELDKLKELKKQQVVSLSEYKNEKSLSEQLDVIRSSRKLNDGEKTALSMVAQRSKSYVDYIIAKQVKDEIENGNWNKKIESEKVKITSEKNLLNKALKAYQDDPKQVLKYGFTPTKFMDQMKEKVSHIKTLEQKNMEDLSKLKMLLNKADQALDIQSDFTRKEFSVLYQSTNNYSVDEMYHAVQYFKETNKVLSEDEISSYAVSKYKEHERNTPSLAEQTRNISKSVFILDRAIQKQMKERLSALKEQNFDLVYEANKKIEQFTLQKDRHEKDLAENVQLLRVNLQKYYSDSLDHITNAEVLLRLQDRQDNGMSSGRVDQDLNVIHQQIAKEINDKPMDNSFTPDQQVERQYSQSVASGLFQALEQAQRANENKKHEKDPTEKKQRRRYRGQELDH